MTTLKDISDTYDCKQLQKKVNAWLQNHTPTVEDIRIYFIRLRTINHLNHYADDPSVVATVDKMVAQLDAVAHQDLITKLVRPPHTEENIEFLARISSQSLSCKRLLLAAWDTGEKNVINNILKVFNSNSKLSAVLFSETFLHSQKYLNFLRKSPEHLLSLTLRGSLSKECLENLKQSGLIDEEQLFPLLSVARQDHDSPLPWIDIWSKMFPDFIQQEAVRIASYLPSGECMDDFIGQLELQPDQKWKVLLEWAGRPDGRPYAKTFVNLMQDVQWDERKFAAFYTINVMRKDYRQEPLEALSVLWVEHMPEALHSYLYPYIVDAKFQPSNDWARQKVILQQETNSATCTKSQRKI